MLEPTHSSSISNWGNNNNNNIKFWERELWELVRLSRIHASCRDLPHEHNTHPHTRRTHTTSSRLWQSLLINLPQLQLRPQSLQSPEMLIVLCVDQRNKSAEKECEKEGGRPRPEISTSGRYVSFFNWIWSLNLAKNKVKTFFTIQNNSHTRKHTYILYTCDAWCVRDLCIKHTKLL